MAPLLELLAKVDPAPGCCGWRVVVAGRRWNVGSNLDGRHHGLRWGRHLSLPPPRQRPSIAPCSTGNSGSPFSSWVDSTEAASDEAFDASMLSSFSFEGREELLPRQPLPRDPLSFAEKVILISVGQKAPINQRKSSLQSFDVEDSLLELERLADTAGLEVVGSVVQMLPEPNPRTYIGTGKISELIDLINDTGASTVLCDDELNPRQQRNLEKAIGNQVRVGDRTALILDVFSQRAATREGKMQVELAKVKYELPRLTRMWTHLERQTGGGQVKGMGEKQIEIDKRLLRKRMEVGRLPFLPVSGQGGSDRAGQTSASGAPSTNPILPGGGKQQPDLSPPTSNPQGLQKDIDEISKTRSVYRRRRQEAGLPVMALVGYTNVGKSTLINRIADAKTLAEDKLFATLDPTTKRIVLESGKEVLITDTVGFIQKLPTQLVAAFRATLEEITEASLLLHVVDVSDPKAAAQSEAVYQVLKEIKASDIPMLTIWNKVDATADPPAIMRVAASRDNTVCISAATGLGMEDLLRKIAEIVEGMMTPMRMLVPYSQGDLVGELYRKGVVNREEFRDQGILVKASVPADMLGRCKPLVTEERFACHEDED